MAENLDTPMNPRATKAEIAAAAINEVLDEKPGMKMEAVRIGRKLIIRRRPRR